MFEFRFGKKAKKLIILETRCRKVENLKRIAESVNKVNEGLTKDYKFLILPEGVEFMETV